MAYSDFFYSDKPNETIISYHTQRILRNASSFSHVPNYKLSDEKKRKEKGYFNEYDDAFVTWYQEKINQIKMYDI